MRRRPTPVFTAPVRGLQIIAVLVTMYGVNGMLTSNGIEPPNVIVFTGVGLASFAALAEVAVGARWYAGWWLYTATVVLALAIVRSRAV